MRDGYKGLYWRRNGSLRYFATLRVKRFGMGLKLTPAERMRLADVEGAA
jgi:hypothetical protein